jgi:hypothetical protein
MMTLSRYLAPAVLATSLGIAAVAAPAPAQAQSDDLVRELVNVADVVMRGNQPYYRYGDYGYDDRLVAQRDAYGRPVYYRYVDRDDYNRMNTYNRSGPPYGNAYGYNRNRGYPVTGVQRTKCNKNGKCTVTYYDPRADRDDRYRDDRYRTQERYWDGYRWRYRD